MQGLKFKIQHPDGTIAEMQVEGDTALVGSGAHCEIRVGIDQGANEHVAIKLLPGGPIAEARSFQPPPTINDAPFQRSPLQVDSVLSLNQTRIWVEAGELDSGKETTKKAETKTSPVTLLLAAIAIPISGYVLLMDDETATEEAAPESPALFGDPVQACPQPQRAAALAWARQRAVLADAKRERRPFDVTDGVAAVPLFEEAAACFAQAGKPKTAAAYVAEAQELRVKMEDDFRTHRVRLEHALSIEDWQLAQREVKVLMAFTDGQKGDYTGYLSNLDRKLRIMYGDEER